MCNITNHVGNTNENHNEIISHLSEWLWSKRQEITIDGKDVKKGAPLCTVGGNINCYNYYKKYGTSSKILKFNYDLIQQFHFWVCRKENKNTN